MTKSKHPSTDYMFGKNDALDGIESWVKRTSKSTWSYDEKCVESYNRGYAKGKEELMLQLLNGDINEDTT